MLPAIKEIKVNERTASKKTKWFCKLVASDNW
jgi:hypothetical protein